VNRTTIGYNVKAVTAKDQYIVEKAKLAAYYESEFIHLLDRVAFFELVDSIHGYWVGLEVSHNEYFKGDCVTTSIIYSLRSEGAIDKARLKFFIYEHHNKYFGEKGLSTIKPSDSHLKSNTKAS